MQAGLNGARLSYVVVPLQGTLKREKVCFEEVPAGKHKDGSPRVTFQMVKKIEDEPAGFLVYFPRGHVIRIATKEKLAHYKLDKASKLVNMQGLNDPNSPLGRLLVEQDDEARRGVWADLQQQVINLATRKSGAVLMPEQVNAQVPVIAAQDAIDQQAEDTSEPVRPARKRR